jgi:cytochrome c oxidase cbb3-type subunit 2
MPVNMRIRYQFIRVIWGVLFVGVMVHHADDASKGKSTPPDRSLYLPGKHIYKVSCQPCHGERGRGDGELVTMDWEVFPRDFSTGDFKYRSTPYGKLPTNYDIKRTILQGIAGSAMPTFHDMSDKDLEAVSEYIKYFSRKWRKEEFHADAVLLPSKPEFMESDTGHREAVESGKVLFARNCAPCHGEQGLGNGPAAATLMDSYGHPVRPANLLTPLGCGESEEDLLRTILTGMTGTPMPAFAEALNEEEVWKIVLLISEWRRSKAL